MAKCGILDSATHLSLHASQETKLWKIRAHLDPINDCLLTGAQCCVSAGVHCGLVWNSGEGELPPASGEGIAGCLVPCSISGVELLRK